MSADAPRPPSAPAAPAPHRDDAVAPTRQVDSAQLFAGAAELLIDHRGVLYRLKQTALGKLILTK